MQWRILDDNVEIDLNYITCAEYQLFIDEKRQAGKNRQPDHWQSYRFSPGDSQKPITGVRASDAAEFCEWLTQQHSALGFRYRLPTLAEVQEYPAKEKSIGCWCNDRGKKVVVGIEATQWQDWYHKLAEVVIIRRNLNINQCLDIYLAFFLNRNLYQDLYQGLNQGLNQVLNQNLNLYFDIYLDLLYLDLNLNRYFSQDLNRDFNKVLNRNLNRDLKLYLTIYQDANLSINLNPDFNPVLKQDLSLYRVLYEKIEGDEASDFLILYFPLLFFIVIYKVVSFTYLLLSQKKDALKQIKLSRKQSEAISRKYQQKIDEIYPLYVYLVLLDERQAGRIPAWEGIRLVRERIES